MSSMHQERQRVIRHYKEVTGITDVNMEEVAKWGVQKGLLVAPQPVDPMKLLARQLSESAREETRIDKKTGRPYRVYHMFTQQQGDQQLHLWADIDAPSTTRVKMHKSLVVRREQMVGDGVQLTFDAMHWNDVHPNEEPINLPMDLGPDIEWRINAPFEDQKAS